MSALIVSNLFVISWLVYVYKHTYWSTYIGEGELVVEKSVSHFLSLSLVSKVEFMIVDRVIEKTETKNLKGEMNHSWPHIVHIAYIERVILDQNHKLTLINEFSYTDQSDIKIDTHRLWTIKQGFREPPRYLLVFYCLFSIIHKIMRPTTITGGAATVTKLLKMLMVLYEGRRCILYK